MFIYFTIWLFEENFRNSEIQEKLLTSIWPCSS